MWKGRMAWKSLIFMIWCFDHIVIERRTETTRRTRKERPSEEADPLSMGKKVEA
jgi:hypothetical protein